MKDAEAKGLMHDSNKMANYCGDVTTAEWIANYDQRNRLRGRLGKQHQIDRGTRQRKTERGRHTDDQKTNGEGQKMNG